MWQSWAWWILGCCIQFLLCKNFKSRRRLERLKADLTIPVCPQKSLQAVSTVQFNVIRIHVTRQSWTWWIFGLLNAKILRSFSPLKVQCSVCMNLKSWFELGSVEVFVVAVEEVQVGSQFQLMDPKCQYNSNSRFTKFTRSNKHINLLQNPKQHLIWFLNNLEIYLIRSLSQ